jgi:hypothetical protein
MQKCYFIGSNRTQFHKLTIVKSYVKLDIQSTIGVIEHYNLIKHDLREEKVQGVSGRTPGRFIQRPHNSRSEK